jgi:hypothetical protein
MRGKRIRAKKKPVKRGRWGPWKPCEPMKPGKDGRDCVCVLKGQDRFINAPDLPDEYMIGR